MSLDFSLEIITLIIACASLAISLVVYVTSQQDVSKKRALERDLDTHAILSEFSHRTKRLEERLVDQKVKLEILELRQQRQNELPKSGDSVINERRQVNMDNAVSLESRVSEPLRRLTVAELPIEKMNQLIGKSSLVRSEIEALKLVLESGTTGVTARDIQGGIGLSREHTARMMNSLFRKGLVERNSDARPFNYRITVKGRQVAME